MTRLKFCPQCGEKKLQYDGRKMSCDCGFVMYQNVAGAVAVVIRCGDEVFLTRRNQQPGLGRLDLPGGFTDPREDAETSCARELYEELKLKIDKAGLKYLTSLPNVYRYKEIDYNTLDLFFEYVVDEKFAVELAREEISEVVWISKKNINLEEIAFDSQRNFFQKYLD